MATASRLVAAFAAVLLLHVAADAQPPTAPPPHLALDELVKEYQRLGLPLPPKNAEVVRIDWYLRRETYREVPEDRFILAFRVPPAKPGDRPRYLEESPSGISLWEMQYVEPDSVELADRTPAALHRVVYFTASHYLSLAVLCKYLGWDDLARAVYTLAREKFIEEGSERPIMVELRDSAWEHWAGQITERDTDRKEALRRLKALAAEEPSFRTPENDWLINSLQAAVTPRNSKPGSVEALIDQLTEYWVDPIENSKPTGDAAYWKLVELGFDAVPALIDHVGDDRLTRGWSLGFNFRSAHKLTVGHLCSRLLFDLSARTIGGGYWELRGDRLDPDEAQKWFEQAKKVGEEKWLLDHAIPKDGGKTITNQHGRPEPHIVRVIGAKYPARLPAIYREMLKQPVSFWLNDYVREIVASKLPRDQKIALLVEGATHDGLSHRSLALDGLAAVDGPQFRKHLLLTLKQEWFGDLGELLPLVERSADRECWDTLVAAVKKAPFGLRTYIIRDVGWVSPPGKKDPSRLERIRFLVQFLDDRIAEEDDTEDWSMVEIRDHAAAQLAGRLGIPVRRNDADIVIPNKNAGAVSRFLLRVMVRQAAERELARKP